MKHLVGLTSDGSEVYVELIGTEAGRQIAHQPQLLSLAKEMLQQITLLEADVTLEYDMKRQIGYSSIITTTEQNIVFYARIIKDTTYTRFVKNVKPEATHHVSIRLKRCDNGNYDLADIWIGRQHPAKPGDPHQTSKGNQYWTTHAFIYSDQQLQASTITKECPY